MSSLYEAELVWLQMNSSNSDMLNRNVYISCKGRRPHGQSKNTCFLNESRLNMGSFQIWDNSAGINIHGESQCTKSICSRGIKELQSHIRLTCEFCGCVAALIQQRWLHLSGAHPAWRTQCLLLYFTSSPAQPRSPAWSAVPPQDQHSGSDLVSPT